MIDPRADRAIYLQVADDLRGQINAGIIPSGAELLPEKALAAHYGIGIDAVQDALAILVNEGRIEKRRGHPSRVRHTPEMARVKVDLAGREIGGRGATEAEAAEYGIPFGSPMLILVELTMQPDGSVHEVELDAWPADRFRLRPEAD
jgi:DNA-binding GntR family transcriptional regulator